MADHDSRSGVRYVSASLLEYCDQVHAPHDDASAMAFLSPEQNDMPPIMVGRSEGKFLGLLVKLVGAKKAVEVGTLAGYSALHIARALPQDGFLWTIENEPHHARIARNNLREGQVDQRVEVVVSDGPAGLDSITESGPFDFVFLDADKERYDIYARWAISHLNPGGLLVVDNAYFFGELLADTTDAAAVRRMHEMVAAELDSVCVPTPDGMVVAIKPR